MSDLRIISRDPVTGVVSLGLPDPPEFISGIDKLVQTVSLTLLNNGRRSIFSAGRTGGIRQLLGNNFDEEDPSEIFADIRLSVSQTEDIILKEQGQTSRPPSEMLQTLQLIDVFMDDETREVNVIIGVVNEEQQLKKTTMRVQ